MCSERKQAFTNKILVGNNVAWHVEATAEILLYHLHGKLFVPSVKRTD